MSNRQWVVSDADAIVRAYHQQISSKGGKATQSALSAEQRTEKARKAGKAGGRGRGKK